MCKFILVNSEEYFHNEVISFLKNNLDNSNVHIIYISEWDIIQKHEIQSRISSILPIQNIHFLDVSFVTNPQKNDFEYLNTISKVLPFVNNFQDLLLCSQHYHSQYHGRVAEDPNPVLDQIRAISIIKFMQKLIEKLDISVVFTFDKSGWERRLIIAFFVSNEINVQTVVPTMHGKMYFWEKITNKNITYLDIQSNEIIKVDLIDFSISRVANYEDKYPDIFNLSIDKDLIYEKRNVELKDKKIVVSFKSALIKLLKVQFNFIKTTFWFGKWSINNILNNNKRYINVDGDDVLTFKKYIYYYFDKFILHLRSTTNYSKYIFNLLLNSSYYTDKNVSKRFSLKNNNSYCLIALHYFPESSTLGEHGMFQNEFQNFRFIQSVNTNNSKYVFIDHPHMFFTGERNSWGKRFFNRIPNSCYYELLTPTGIPFELIQNSEHVFTITGTIALEAALLEKNVTIFNLHPVLWVNNISIGYLPSKIVESVFIIDSFNSADNYQKIAFNFGIPKDKILTYLFNEYQYNF